MDKSLDFSVVVPVFNSEKTVEKLYARLKATFEKMGSSFEAIFVNDDSTDNSWNKLKELKKREKENITLVNLTRNFGQHKALLCGFNFTKGKQIITIDDDLQTAPEDIPLLVEKHEASGAGVVYGIYEKKQHSGFRNIGSKMVERMFKVYASTPGKGSSFKLISGEIIDNIKTHSMSYIYVDELISWYANKVDFVMVTHSKRDDGKSGYSLFKLMKMTLNLVMTYTVVPLRIMTYFGLFSAIVCFGFVVYFVILKYTTGAELGFTALIVTIFLSTGLILFCLGIIGEYISRIFAMQSRKPPFSIKEIV